MSHAPKLKSDHRWGRIRITAAWANSMRRLHQLQNGHYVSVWAPRAVLSRPATQTAKSTTGQRLTRFHRCVHRRRDHPNPGTVIVGAVLLRWLMSRSLFEICRSIIPSIAIWPVCTHPADVYLCVWGWPLEGIFQRKPFTRLVMPCCQKTPDLIVAVRH
jgi:hypothetical protein